ncbi:MAG TPA: hypothetical protein VG963_02595 [Polyangiaceae bacterium]|nr:hypothetical protein [Polyangiaceae bacterium]
MATFAAALSIPAVSVRSATCSKFAVTWPKIVLAFATISASEANTQSRQPRDRPLWCQRERSEQWLRATACEHHQRQPLTGGVQFWILACPTSSHLFAGVAQRSRVDRSREELKSGAAMH